LENEPVPDAARIEGILVGARLPETEDEMTLERVLAALQAPGTPDELRDADAAAAGLAAAVRAEKGHLAALPEKGHLVATSEQGYVNVALPEKGHLAATSEKGSGEVVPMRPSRRTRSAVVAVCGAAAILLLGAASAAAFTGSLPAPLQSFAQRWVGAPAPQAEGSATATSEQSTSASQSPATSAAPSHSPAAHSGGPVLGPQVQGWCRAFGDRATDDPARGSQAYAALDAAAQAQGLTVEAFCAPVLARPTSDPSLPPVAEGPTGAGGPSAPGSQGQGRKPSAPPGQVSNPAGGHGNKPSTPPGQAHAPGQGPAAPSTQPSHGNAGGNGNGNGNGKPSAPPGQSKPSPSAS
jgi:hypothetical protein